MSRSPYGVALVAAGLVAAGGCAGEMGRESGSGTGRAPDAEGIGAPGSTTPAEYATALLFIDNEGRSADALHLLLSHRTSPAGLQREYRGWMLTGARWRSVLNGRWQDPATRAPWRPLPADSLQIIVTDDGEPDAFLLRAEGRGHTLDLGGALESWEDRGGIRHTIRFGRLVRRGESRAGILLEHRFVIPQPRLPAAFGPHQSAIVRTGDGLILVLFESGNAATHGDSFAWLYNQGLSRRWPGLETRVVEVVSASELRRNLPVRIGFTIPEADLRGELAALTREVMNLGRERGPVPYYALYRVQGWLEFEGARTSIEGVLVRGEP